jgi:mono/diheme cytochrome c family protein
MMCHSREANFSLTLHEWQLNRGDQLARWERMDLLRSDPGAPGRGRRGNEAGGGRFARQQPDQRTPPLSALLPREPSQLGRFTPPGDATASLETRARSYLAVNCAHCHTINGGGNSAINFDWLAPVDRMRAIGEPPQHGHFDLTDARVIAPGAAGRSVIIPRVAMRGPGQMPPVGSRVPDTEGVRLLAEWIASLRE